MEISRRYPGERDWDVDEYFDLVVERGSLIIYNFRLMRDGEIRGPLYWKDGWCEGVGIHPDLHDKLHELLGESDEDTDKED